METGGHNANHTVNLSVYTQTKQYTPITSVMYLFWKLILILFCLWQSRPLTRFLPCSSQDFDLRNHIENAGHNVQICKEVSFLGCVWLASLGRPRCAPGTKALTSFQWLTRVSPHCGMGHWGWPEVHDITTRGFVIVRLALVRGSTEWALRGRHGEANRTHPKMKNIFPWEYWEHCVLYCIFLLYMIGKY